MNFDAAGAFFSVTAETFVFFFMMGAREPLLVVDEGCNDLRKSLFLPLETGEEA